MRIRNCCNYNAIDYYREEVMNYTLTDDDRKLLTEKVLGECWHERGTKGRFNPYTKTETWECGKCGNKGTDNRSFATLQDRHDLAEALMEKRLWGDFESSAYGEWIESSIMELNSFAYWLLVEQPERFAILCCLFMEEGR
jgi:hypothetical protein